MRRGHLALVGMGRALLLAGVVLRMLIVWLLLSDARDHIAWLQRVPPEPAGQAAGMVTILVVVAVMHLVALVIGAIAWAVALRGHHRSSVGLAFLAAGFGMLDLLFLLGAVCLWLAEPDAQTIEAAPAPPDGNGYP